MPRHYIDNVVRAKDPVVGHQAQLAGGTEKSCHTLSLHLADEAATTRARLAGLAMHGHAERVAHLHINNLANPLAQRHSIRLHCRRDDDRGPRIGGRTRLLFKGVRMSTAFGVVGHGRVAVDVKKQAAREVKIALPQSPSDQPDRQLARFQHQPDALVWGKLDLAACRVATPTSWA